MLLFTDSFPYGDAEPFLETELTYLAEHFERIEIIPRRYGGMARTARHVPESVHCWPPLMPDSSALSLLKAVLAARPTVPLVREANCRRVWRNANHLRKWLEASALVRHGLQHPRLRELRRSRNIKALCYFYWGLGAAWLAPFLPRRTIRVARFHGYDVYEERPAYNNYMPFRHQLLQSLDYAVFVSDHGLAYMKEKYADIPWQGRVMRLGVEDFGCNPAPESGPFRVVSCSGLKPVKRVHLIAEALQLMSIPVQWTHFGDGRDRSAVEQAVAVLPGTIHCEMRGHLPNREIRQAFVREPYDLFLNVSSSEGVPVSIMEALSSGIPVLATSVGGVPELVDEQVGGLLSQNVTPRQLAEAMEALHASPERLHKCRQAARQRGSSEVDARTNYTRFARFLTGLQSPDGAAFF